MENNIELNEMRSQLNLLKQKLDKQEIVTGKMLRDTMKEKVEWINRQNNFSLWMGIVAIVLCGVSFACQGLPWWFIVFTELLVGAATIYTWWGKKLLARPNLMDGNLLEVRATVMKAKKRDINWLKYGTPWLLPWFGYYLWSIYDGSEINMIMCVGGLTGGTVGAILGISLVVKTQRRYNEIMRQIDEMEG